MKKVPIFRILLLLLALVYVLTDSEFRMYTIIMLLGIFLYFFIMNKKYKKSDEEIQAEREARMKSVDTDK